MGLETGTVKLEKHNDNWKHMFNEEKDFLKTIFKDLAIDIQHVGSTSINYICAKPIIDIAVGLESLEDFLKVKNIFLDEPYSVKEDPTEGEELVRKGYPKTSYLIHIMEFRGQRYKDTILFRDYMNSHPEKAKAYEKLKIELALKYKDNRKMYTKSKNNFIKEVLNEAYKQ